MKNINIKNSNNMNIDQQNLLMNEVWSERRHQ